MLDLVDVLRQEANSEFPNIRRIKEAADEIEVLRDALRQIADAPVPDVIIQADPKHRIRGFPGYKKIALDALGI